MTINSRIALKALLEDHIEELNETAPNASKHLHHAQMTYALNNAIIAHATGANDNASVVHNN